MTFRAPAVRPPTVLPEPKIRTPPMQLPIAAVPASVQTDHVATDLVRVSLDGDPGDVVARDDVSLASARAADEVAGAEHANAGTARCRGRPVPRDVGADVAAPRAWRRRELNAVAAEVVHDDGRGGAPLTWKYEPWSGRAGAAPVELDDRRAGVARLRCAVDRVFAREPGQRGGDRDRLRPGEDRESDHVHVGARVRGDDRLAQRAVVTSQIPLTTSSVVLTVKAAPRA